MEVRLAESAGFCFGVERAVSTVYRELENTAGPIYTYGPIIHNEEVVADLTSRGVRILKPEDDLSLLPRGTVVLRSHGIGKAEQMRLENAEFTVVDATCPFVKKIHHIVEEAGERGDRVIILGDAEHPEVKGIQGWCGNDSTVVSTFCDIFSQKSQKNVILVTQTTFNEKKFKEIVEKIRDNMYNITVVNTICNATQKRQAEAEEIASAVDAMIVIGGQNSSNTRKLYEICRNHCKETYYIQTLVDLIDQGFKPVRSVGITAGASTPKKIIEEVQTYVREF